MQAHRRILLQRSLPQSRKPVVELFVPPLEHLPAVNASLNATAGVLLVLGLLLIRRRMETAHTFTMCAAFGVSMLFLGCYLYYHFHVGSVKFTGPQPIRTVYLVILLTHVVLAAAVPFLASWTIYLGFRDRRMAHRRWANRTFPIWLYVSITGVVIYFMLYHLYPAPRSVDTINQAFVGPKICIRQG
jgi:putative membrane protein